MNIRSNIYYLNHPKKFKTTSFAYKALTSTLKLNKSYSLIFLQQLIIRVNLNFFFIKLFLKNDFITIFFYTLSFYIFITNVTNNLFLLSLYNYKITPTIKNNKYSKYYNTMKTNNQLFVNNLIKHGSKLKYINLYSTLFIFFYNNFQYFDQNLHTFFPLYSSFYNLSKSNIIFYVLDYFYHLLMNQYNYIFFVKIASIPRKLKKNKKIKKKYNIYVSYLRPTNRFKWILKQIILSHSCFNFNKFVNRLYFAFSSVLLSPDQNFLKDQQLKIYKNILKTKKNF